MLRNSFLTRNLDQKDIDKVVNALEPREFLEGETIIKYGYHGCEYFLITEGNVQVLTYNQDADPDDPDLDKKIQSQKIIGRGSGFGEIALLQNGKRTATIRANEDCTIYALDGSVFKSIIEPSIDKRFTSQGFLVDLQMT